MSFSLIDYEKYNLDTYNGKTIFYRERLQRIWK